MTTQFEQLIESFLQGSSTLEAMCQQLTRESQADPARTRFWGQRVEAEMKRGRIDAAVARTMLDALEGFQSDKTMWLLDPLGRSPSAGAQELPSAGPSRSGPAIAAPASATPSVAAIETTEQLRATLFAPVARRRRGDTVPAALRDAHSASVEWLEGSAPAAAPALLRTQHSGSCPSRHVDSCPAHSASLDLVPLGTVIKDRYRLIAHLGAGGIGQVFDAIDLSQPVETHVTLKIVAVNLKHEPYALDALTTAVRQSRHLEHPNIVRVYDIDQHEDRVFITMEPLHGRWLSGMVREARNKGMSHAAAWPIIEGIANGLAYAHAHGVVHADLSPHAVFIGADGTAKIVGFGLIHAVPASNESLDVLDTLTLRAYTEAYTADAWAQQGKPHPADDLYPLGVIAYEMLTGVHPFSRCSLAVARQKGLTCAPIEGLNRRAHKLIERCLSFEREMRPKDGRSFLKRMRPGVFERLRLANA